MMRIAAFCAFILTIIGANWALETYGVVSVGFGLTAPAGVYFAGLTFGFRDILHELGGKAWVASAILIGAVVSYVISDGATIPGGHVSIAVASGLAFAFSEFADYAVYTPIRQRNWPSAVVASNLVGAVVDSALFLWLAFGSTDLIWGQIVGKMWMTIPVMAIMWLCRDQILGDRVRATDS